MPGDPARRPLPLGQARSAAATERGPDGQLAERYRIRRVWARDPWHLASHLLRKVLGHTLALLFNHREGNSPLQ